MKAVTSFQIDRQRVFSPATLIERGWTIWRGPINGNGLEGGEVQDARALALTELDLSRLRFEPCLKAQAKSIAGEEKIRRLTEEMSDCIRLDAMLGQQLLEEPGQATLEWLYRNRKITWFDLPGTILRHLFGRRYVLYLYRHDDGRWGWGYRWLYDIWGAEDPSGLLASLELGT